MVSFPSAPADATLRSALPRLRMAVLFLLLSTVFAVGRTTAAAPEIALENLDGVPSPNRLVFNRIAGFSPGTHHATATLRIHNAGDAPLAVSQLTIAGVWEFYPLKPTLPASIAPAAFLDVPLRIKVDIGGDYHTGTLEVVSNDADEGRLAVELAGFWQSVSEGGMEPGLGQIVRVFGYTTTIVSPGQNLARGGRVEAVGEEVLSSYWRRVDATKPVAVRQLAAFHGCCDPGVESAYIQWFPKGSPGSRAQLFRHAGVDSQTLLPRLADANGNPLAQPAAAAFNPTALFGFRVDGEWSDSTLNNPVSGTSTACTATTCHRIRFWPVRDRAGALVPNTYLMTGDYNTSNPNYDYNDNLYLLSNLQPETAPTAPSTAHSLYRIDTGGTRDYLDSNGNWWTPDAGLFSPPTAPVEGLPDAQAPADIDLTRDDLLFASYRGNVGNLPQAQRVLTYNLPVGGPGVYNVRLYFAERFHNAANKRRFDVLAEGAVLFDNFDIWTAAAGRDRSHVTSILPVTVSDGALTLTFRAEIDYPSVAGIEVYCAAACPGSPPPTPGVSPTPSPSPSPVPPAPGASPGASPAPAPNPSPGASPNPSTPPLAKRGWLPMAQK